MTGVLRYNFQYNLIHTEKVQPEGLVIERIYGIAKKSILLSYLLDIWAVWVVVSQKTISTDKKQ